MSPPPSHRASPGSPDRPIALRLAVVVTFVLTVLGAAFGVGVFGGEPIDEAAGGLLAADATLLAPASPAFRIWSVIYLGLGVYAVWQLVVPRTSRPITLLAIASLLLNAAWILVIQAGWVAISVLVILALLVVLAEIFRRLSRGLPRSTLERVVVDGTFGLYLGWVSVATCANITSALMGAGFQGFGLPQVWAIAVLLVVAVVGVGVTVLGRRPVATPLAMAWGLGWIAAGRALDEPYAPAVAVTAVVVALIIAAAAIVGLVRATPQQAVAGGRSAG